MPPMISPALMAAVGRNCDIASSGQAGHFSLCGLLLRLRQLFKWEHGLAPWIEPEPAAVLEWIAQRERTWDELEGAAWGPLDLDGVSLDPFAIDEVNAYLCPRRLAYGGGLSRGLTPTFFLGELAAVRQEAGLTILMLGPELARDLDASPGLCQGTLIYARRQTLGYYLWDRLSDPTQQNNAYLALALKTCGLSLKGLLRDPEAHQKEFENFVAAELEAVIRHEMGESLEPSLKSTFPALLALFPQTRVELFARALKDVLADVSDWGRLAYLVMAQQLSSLAILLAWRPGLYPLLLPEIEPAFRTFMATGDWEVIEAARREALGRLRQMAEGLTALLDEHEAGPTNLLQAEIQRRYLVPLGL